MQETEGGKEISEQPKIVEVTGCYQTPCQPEPKSSNVDLPAILEVINSTKA